MIGGWLLVTGVGILFHQPPATSNQPLATSHQRPREARISFNLLKLPHVPFAVQAQE